MSSPAATETAGRPDAVDALLNSMNDSKLDVSSQTTAAAGVSGVSLNTLLEGLLKTYAPNITTVKNLKELFQPYTFVDKNVYDEAGMRLVFGIDPSDKELQDMVHAVTNLPDSSKLFIFLHVSKDHLGNSETFKELMGALVDKVKFWEDIFLVLPMNAWQHLKRDFRRDKATGSLQTLRTLCWYFHDKPKSIPIHPLRSTGRPMDSDSFDHPWQIILEELCRESDGSLRNLFFEFRASGSMNTFLRGGMSKHMFDELRPADKENLPLPHLKDLLSLKRMHILKPSSWNNICFALERTKNTLEHISFIVSTDIAIDSVKERHGTFSLQKLQTLQMTIKQSKSSETDLKNVLYVLKSLGPVELPELKHLAIDWDSAHVDVETADSTMPRDEGLTRLADQFVESLGQAVGNVRQDCTLAIKHFSVELVGQLKKRFSTPAADKSHEWHGFEIVVIENFPAKA